MNTEQAFAEGFVKRASEYGYNEDESREILKQAGLDQFKRNIMAALIKKPAIPSAVAHGVAGAGLGGAAGGFIGGVNNLIDPGTEVDPETGKTVDRSRLKAMLMGSLKGFGIGAGIGGGVGTGYGASVGNRIQHFKNIDPDFRRKWRRGGVDLGKEFNKDVRPTTPPPAIKLLRGPNYRS
jgi:hypothetical protein